MNRKFLTLCAALGMFLFSEAAHASPLSYGGYQPWWNIFHKRTRYQSYEEERLQRFWHDYYDALRRYYHSLDHIDWVSYYKNHGYQINAGCGGPGGAGMCGGTNRVQYAPVFVSPSMQWAVPNGALSGPPGGPAMGGGAMMGGPGMGGPGMGGGYPPPY